MRAKLLFDTYNWTWMQPDKEAIPTIGEIEEEYIELAKHAYEYTEKFDEDTGEKHEEGQSTCGRLTVTYVSERWEFGVELAIGYSDEDEVDESCSTVEIKLANKSELGYVTND